MSAAAIFIYSSISSFYLILSVISFYRAKDVFAMTKLAMMINFYVVPLVIIALQLQQFELESLIKVIILIALNLVFSSLICHLIVRRAIANKIYPDEKE